MDSAENKAPSVTSESATQREQIEGDHKHHQLIPFLPIEIRQQQVQEQLPQQHIIIVKNEQRLSKKTGQKLTIAKSLKKFNSNQCAFKKSLLVADLELGKLYHVVQLKKVQTRYGLRLLAEFSKTQLYFPAHMADNLNHDDIDVINAAEHVYLVPTKEDDGNTRFNLVNKRQQARRKLAANQ